MNPNKNLEVESIDIKIEDLETEINSNEHDSFSEETVISPVTTKGANITSRVKNELVLGTDCGNIYYICSATGQVIYKLAITTVPLTSLLFDKGFNEFIYMCIGSLDKVFKIYDYNRRKLVKALPLDDQVNCMCAMWGYIFIGCKNGTLVRYSIEKSKFEFGEKHIGLSIIVIKAVQEGSHKMLIVGYKGASIYIRCAMSSAYLRHFSREAIPRTVGSLILENNLLYCETAQQGILVFSFHTGKLVKKISPENLKEISSIKIVNSHIFTSCYNGKVYVYNLEKQSNVAILEGPRGIISMEILHNQVILGTSTKKLISIPIPNSINVYSK
ncbi:uncharacterized protein LOC115882451 [Sitophilus oryzae]|uniref:Uncharacterized protein LOC115882451 n=1 Tax=Sitophilus oryzae TaxID=7048 RepID=A0A6J2XZ94_SITOR|nr:uncharacterized protein LOC115882451 [Sitophilus oryzae]